MRDQVTFLVFDTPLPTLSATAPALLYLLHPCSRRQQLPALFSIACSRRDLPPPSVVSYHPHPAIVRNCSPCVASIACSRCDLPPSTIRGFVSPASMQLAATAPCVALDRLFPTRFTSHLHVVVPLSRSMASNEEPPLSGGLLFFREKSYE
jgi:hypothetical protein